MCAGSQRVDVRWCESSGWATVQLLTLISSHICCFVKAVGVLEDVPFSGPETDGKTC